MVAWVEDRHRITGSTIFGTMFTVGTTSSVVEAPVAPPRFEPLDPALKQELLTHIDDRGQVTVHCRFASPEFHLIRIWRSTFLICRQTGNRSELLHAEGIVLAPQWMPVPSGEVFVFTLVFAPLPQACAVFDLVELIPQPGGFHVPDIRRNERDLYDVEI